MSKKNGKGLNESVEAYQDEKLSSGVMVRILPFPARLHDNLQSKSLEKFPEPLPPKKIVKVVDGTEETDDLNNPDYLKTKELADRQRQEWFAKKLGETIIDFCIMVDTEPYEHIIRNLEKTYEEEAPKNPDERRAYFLTNYAIRGRADYERVMVVSQTLMAVGDKEIAARMDSFRGEMARATGLEIEASGPNADIRLGLVE